MRKTRCDCFALSESNGIHRNLPLEGAKNKYVALAFVCAEGDLLRCIYSSLPAECSPVYVLLGAFGDWQVSRSFSSANKPQKSH